MKHGRVILACASAAGVVAAFAFQNPSVDSSPSWPQWGGPGRDFQVKSTGLAEAWSEEGPPVLWRRRLGDGYSAIVAENDALFTMYRDATGEREGEEVVVSLDAGTGQTRWEHRYEEYLVEKMDPHWGSGPYSTPLIAGDRLFAVGVMARLQALDRRTGRLLWSRDLYNEFSMPRIGMKTNRGYASSPLAYRDTLILPVGGPGQAVVAFRQSDGSVAWKRHDFKLSPSSPLLIQVDGQEQLILFMAEEIIGLNPENGDLYWSHPHKTEFDLNISAPVWGNDNLLYMSSAYDGGSRVIELKQENGTTSVRELWFNSRMRVHFGSVIRVGDAVYGSSGDFGPAFFMGVDVKTGQVLWRQRGLAKAQIIFADNKFVMVDEDGHLALGRLGEKGLNILSKVELLKSRAWTVPTVVGTTLYVRDRESILAVDLAVQGAGF